MRSGSPIYARCLLWYPRAKHSGRKSHKLHALPAAEARKLACKQSAGWPGAGCGNWGRSARPQLACMHAVHGRGHVSDAGFNKVVLGCAAGGMDEDVDGDAKVKRTRGQRGGRQQAAKQVRTRA